MNAILPREICMTAASLLMVAASMAASKDTTIVYPDVAARTLSPGNTTYYIDPQHGNDANTGLASDQAWRGFHPINRLLLAPGDQVEIRAPGAFDHTLALAGKGTAQAPIEVRFAAGRYDLHPDNAYRETYQISNTNSDPEGRKAVGILLAEARHFRITGPDAMLVCRGKMIMIVADGCEDVLVGGFGFDYHRPTVSEFRVEEDGILSIHPDSRFEVREDAIVWLGEGWSHSGGLFQELDPETNRVRRIRDPLAGAVVAPLPDPLNVSVRNAPNLKLGRIYQVRDPFRDCAGFFTRNSKDITWKDLRIRFMHGMGMVSQFSENLTYDSIEIAPDPAGTRSTAAWADGIHVSGCRGRVVIRNCQFSGAHDDAVNIHGTHLRIVEKLSPHRVRARFMHPQTFGFSAFHAGDEVEFVRTNTLETYGPNRVTAAEMDGPKDTLLTFEHPIPEEFEDGDALENVTWTPEVEITGCSVRRIPTRGFLLTTRRPVLVERNQFHATHMSALLIENDAQGWFESGCVRDMTIRDNAFFQCGEPVIHINPRNDQPNPAGVHRKIRILNNSFHLIGTRAIRAKSTAGLVITGNRLHVPASIPPGTPFIETPESPAPKIHDNPPHPK